VAGTISEARLRRVFIDVTTLDEANVYRVPGSASSRFGRAGLMKYRGGEFTNRLYTLIRYCLKTEAYMYRNILVAYNGTPESRSALEECVRLAPHSPTGIHLLAVIDPQPTLLAGEFGASAAYSQEEKMTIEKKKMSEDLSEGQVLLQNAGLDVITHLEVGEPADVIAELVTRLDIDLVIVGHPRHKSWAMRWWRGSTDALLIEKVPCTLMVAPAPAPH
jgi:nucleotide-binding universal stress UspA family protein